MQRYADFSREVLEEAGEQLELRATLGGELQLLRAIRHIVIQEMVARVSGHA